MRAALFVVLAVAAVAPSSASVVNKYRYDARGRVVIADQSVTTGSGHTATYSYDKADNRTTVDVSVTTRSIWLPSGQTLLGGQSVVSQDGRFRLTMQRDGNLALFDERGRRLWHTNTAGQPGSRLVMQGDGHLAVVTSGDAVAWSSGTAGNFGAALAVQVDGNLVIYHGTTALWAIGACTSCS